MLIPEAQFTLSETHLGWLRLKRILNPDEVSLQRLDHTYAARPRYECYNTFTKSGFQL